MLVPDSSEYVARGDVEWMQTPGAAIVCADAETEVAKFEKPAGKSSTSPGLHGGVPPVPPGAPSLSDIAVTVSTSGYTAGSSGSPALKSRASLPAATV